MTTAEMFCDEMNARMVLKRRSRVYDAILEVESFMQRMGMTVDDISARLLVGATVEEQDGHPTAIRFVDSSLATRQPDGRWVVQAS